MKHNRKRRLVSLVMVFAMLLSYIPGTVWAVDPTTDIKAIEKPTGISIVEDYDDYVGDNWLNELELPTTVIVTLANNTKQEVPVTWDSSNLDTRTTGYYSLPGTVSLPAGVTNGQNLDVSITVQVRKYQNLIPNGSFEDGTTGWKIQGSGAGCVTSPVKDGQYAGASGTWAVNATNKAFADARNMTDEIGDEIAKFGAGQYYYSFWAQANIQSVPAGMQMQTWFLYKTDDGSGNLSASTIVKAEKLPISNSEYVQSAGIVDLPENVAWGRMDMYFSVSNAADFNGMRAYFDHAELIALKVPLKVEPSAIAEIKTEVLSRSVVVNYPDYVGEDWKSALGLPTSVEVVTDNGTVAEVDVTWSYAGLDFTKYGKYTLVGKLDDSGFPNPKGLTVQQNIYVVKPKNLIPNGGFENGTTGWKLQGSEAGCVTSPVKDGSYAGFGGGTWTASGKDVNLADTRNMVDEIGTAIGMQGAGQYYFSFWSQAKVESVPTGMEMQTWLYYKTKNESGELSSSTIMKAERVAVSNKEFVQSAGILDMPKDVAWSRLEIRFFAKEIAEFNGFGAYFDQAELIPLNVTIPKGQEPAEIEEVISEIPVRAVVKDYNKYVGANWQTALGLPERVEVRTANGNTALVEVTWNYENLNLREVGKYILVGTLDNSSYPNPKELYVTQTIYIREYKNLISNPSFESGTTGWKFQGTPSRVTSPVKLGKYAVSNGTWTADNTNESLADTRDMVDELGAAIGMQGAGQYYLSFWSQANTKSVPAGMDLQTWLYYKTKNEDGELSASTIMKADKVPVSSKEYVQSAGVIDIPENVAWARLEMRFFVKEIAEFNGFGAYFDHAELIPLNILIERYEGEMEVVETIIPQRKIIQNYQDYLGGSYTIEDLMLPEYVKVRSSTGQVVDIAVNWDISKLDLTKTGTYNIPGTLEQMRLDNPNGLSVLQVIQVVSYKNLLSNPSFEDYGDDWTMSSNATSELGIMSPVKDGKLAMQIIVDRLDAALGKENIQAMWGADPYDLGLRVAATGGGQYYFGGWAQGTKDSTDMPFYTRLWYRTYENGDSSLSFMAPRITPSTKEYLSSGSIVTMPSDIFWTRLDVCLGGGVDAMSMSHLYVDHMELVPLNVEVPSMNDIVDCETVANAYAHQGTKFEDLGLPETLEVTLRTGQYIKLGVNWDKTAYDPNKIGEQTITGTLAVGTRYKNPLQFAPSVVVTIRAKGEDLRQSIYISTSGNEDNDGLSPAKPKKDVTKIATYLAQGYNVRLKKGDTWYLPLGSFSFKNIYGTENAPLMITSYGEGAKPIIAFMMKIENSAWRLVDQKRNVYAADVSALGQLKGESVHRCFSGDEAYFHKTRSNYVSLDEEEFCSYNNTVYLRLPAGEAPKDIEVTSMNGGTRFSLKDVSYLTIEDVHIKGGSPVLPLFHWDAPTKYVKVTKCNLTHTWDHLFTLEANDERLHYKPEFSYLYTDTMMNKKEGALSGYYEVHWDPHGNEGITMRDGVEGAWIHHNHMRQLAHCYVAVESLDAAEEYKTKGVFNCVTEDNVFEAGNVLYSRCFTFSSNFNLSGTQMCRDNTFRRNKVYDMTVAPHYFGENNLVYSNLFAYLHTTYNEDGTLFDGKSAKSFGLNTDPWSGKNCVGNIAINNTFYDVTGAALVTDVTGSVYKNLYANNLVINWESDPNQGKGVTGAFHDNSLELNYFMHNGLYDMDGDIDHFCVDGSFYTAADVNNSVSGYKGNMSADPLFKTADLSLLGKGVRQDFTLSGESPMRYAGLSLYDPIFATFPAWERLKAEYTDINGVVYLAESPSIGAWSFCELIEGDVTEVGKLDDVLCRPGATVDQLQLPDSVPAVNDKGIDVVLLVNWNTATFDSSKPGTITLTGELRNGPHTNLNINGKTASINVNVKDKLELMNIVTRVDTLTVLYGTSFEGVLAQLPSALHVVEESGFEEELPVTWICDDYDGNDPGDYTFKCVLPEDMLTNTREFDLEVTVRVMHELGRGVELLINPDFVDGSSASPWALGFLSGQYGNYRITTDPELLPEGEPGGAIITVSRRYASIQQDVAGQMKLMGDGKYLFRVKMRAYDPAQPIDTSYPCLQLLSASTVTHRCRPIANIGDEYVEYYKIMDVYDVADAQQILFHTSTMKSLADAEDGPRSFIIAGCSLIYLGKTDAEVEATLDSIDLTWNTIKGENGFDQSSVTSNLQLPTKIGTASTIKWTSSDESVITNDGKVTMGRVPKTVTMTATITYKGKETVKKFMVTVPRDPNLPTFSGSLTGSQTAQVGDEINVTIKLNAENATTFNAYRFTLSFNVTRLEYVGISDPTSTVEVDNGSITISGIGTERPITDTITLTFKVLKSGVTEVKLVKVEMDNDPNASLDNLPTMTVTEGAAVIDVQSDGSNKKDDDKTTVNAEKDNSVVIWIVIGLVAAALIAGGAIAVILIKKKKQTPPTTEE